MVHLRTLQCAGAGPGFPHCNVPCRWSLVDPQHLFASTPARHRIAVVCSCQAEQ